MSVACACASHDVCGFLWRSARRGHQSPGAGVTGKVRSYLYVGTQTQVLYKSSKCSYCWVISPSFLSHVLSITELAFYLCVFFLRMLYMNITLAFPALSVLLQLVPCTPDSDGLILLLHIHAFIHIHLRNVLSPFTGACMYLCLGTTHLIP